MSDTKDPFLITWWTENLEEVDREIAKMATLCQVKILDAGVIKRVLQKDASVCATSNPAAFAKLHDMLMLHLAIREKSSDTVGQAQTGAIEDYIIERLRKSFLHLEGPWPPQ